jgi:hypothetical protein
LSAGIKERNDYTVFVMGGRVGDKIHIIDCKRIRIMGNLEKLEALMEMMYEWGVVHKDGKDYHPTGNTIDVWSEAVAYQADNSAAVPMLQYLATARNITVDEMVQKVLAARTAYHADLATLLSKKQSIELEIKNCQTIPELNIVIHRRFGYDMPSNQKIDLNWEGSSTNDL